MKFLVVKLLVVFCFFVTNTSYSQLPHCCKGKKVKIKKGRKSKGALTGVKGHDDKKALKNKMKELKSAAKDRDKEKKAAAKEAKIAAAIEAKEAKIAAAEAAAREEEEQLIKSEKSLVLE